MQIDPQCQFADKLSLHFSKKKAISELSDLLYWPTELHLWGLKNMVITSHESDLLIIFSFRVP